MALKEAGNVNGYLDWADKNDSPYPDIEFPKCINFLGKSQQFWEITATSVIALVALLYAYPRLRLPGRCSSACQRQEPVGKRILLLLLCLAFGLELGVKLATRRVFWIGKPSHLATMIQIFLLIAPPSRIVTAAFRLQMYMLIGIPLVVFYPVNNMELSLFEIWIGIIQHILMLVIPFYLMRIGDPYTPEALGDLSWALIAYVFLFLYHFLPLQLLTFVANVDLNSMLYPVSLCQSQSRIYHLLMFSHQLLLIPTFGKLLVIIAKAFKMLPCSNPLDETNVYPVSLRQSQSRIYRLSMFCHQRLIPTFGKLLVIIAKPFKMLPSSNPLDETNVYINRRTPKHHGIVSCCSALALKHSSASESDEYNTDEDSGCVDSRSVLNRSPCHRPDPYRSCLNDQKEFNSYNVHTKYIVNGELVDGEQIDNASCKKWARDTPGNIYMKTSPSRAGKSSVCRGFLMNDSQDSSPEVSVEKTVLASDLQASRNSCGKSH